MIYLCLDPGLEHTGVAISYEGELVEPLTTLSSTNLVAQIIALLKKHYVDILVIGEPESGPAKDLGKILYDEIKHHFGKQIVFHPEDLSSKMATRKLVEAGTALLRRRELKHSAAAALILEDYLQSAGPNLN